MTRTVLRNLAGPGIAVTMFALLAGAQQMPQTTTEKTVGAATTKTEELRGTVVFVEGNNLVVRMSSGDIRHFNVPETRKFIVDGKELTVSELKPGTKLKATTTTTTTPVTERTTTVGTGKVWFVSGNSVILTLPNGENKTYKVSDSQRFIVDGKKASVHDLRKGMVISAEKIVEVPSTVMVADTVVTGEAPPEVARTPVPETPAAEPAPAAPAPAPTPAPVEQAAAQPSELPKSGSPLPLVGLAGLACIGMSLVLRRLRR